VLIVDDYGIDRRLAGALVAKVPGLRATFAADGAEALAALTAAPPAVVLTDLQMPGMDGLALVEAIRARHPEVPVVLMTAHGSEEVALQALRAGAASYVPKRLLARELAGTLRQVLGIATAGRTRRRLLGGLERREVWFRIENDPALIAPLIELLQEDLTGMGVCDASSRLQVGVALQEALANSLYHGNLEVSSDLRQDDERLFFAEAGRRRGLEPFRSRRIHVEARFEPEAATYVIRDEGPGFDTAVWNREPDPEDLMRIGGRGLLLIRTFMDEVAHNALGNQVTLVKRRAGCSRCLPLR
jgi:CheY-like chemotaxis protein